MRSSTIIVALAVALHTSPAFAGLLDRPKPLGSHPPSTPPKHFRPQRSAGKGIAARKTASGHAKDVEGGYAAVQSNVVRKDAWKKRKSDLEQERSGRETKTHGKATTRKFAATNTTAPSGGNPSSYVERPKPGTYSGKRPHGKPTTGAEATSYVERPKPGTYSGKRPHGKPTTGAEPTSYIERPKPGTYSGKRPHGKPTTGAEATSYVERPKPGTYSDKRPHGKPTTGAEPTSYIERPKPGTYSGKRPQGQLINAAEPTSYLERSKGRASAFWRGKKTPTATSKVETASKSGSAASTGSVFDMGLFRRLKSVRAAGANRFSKRSAAKAA